MNADAKEFFNENPQEPYWYWTSTLRVPNPRLKPWEYRPRTPWPQEE